MNRRKIRKNYEVVDYVDEKGKVRSKVVYTGSTYRPVSVEKWKKLRVTAAILVPALAVTFAVPLLLPLRPTRTLYFILPYIGQVFPIFFLILFAFNVLFKKPPYREEVKSTIAETSKIWCVVGAVLSGLAAAGFAAFWIVSGAEGADFLAGAAALVCAGGYLLLLKTVTELKLRKEENGEKTP